jgi:hypothetical protein
VKRQQKFNASLNFRPLQFAQPNSLKFNLGHNNNFIIKNSNIVITTQKNAPAAQQLQAVPNNP